MFFFGFAQIQLKSQGALIKLGLKIVGFLPKNDLNLLIGQIWKVAGLTGTFVSLNHGIF